MRARPLGDSALLLDWPNSAEEIANRRARVLFEWLNRSPPPGLFEAIPAARSLLVLYDPRTFPKDDVVARAGTAQNQFAILPQPRSIELPVVYGGAFGVDLAQAAAERNLSEQSFVDIHSGAVYTVAFLGFAPGFPYLSGLPSSIALARLPAPRVRVPQGSVAIAGRYCGIYPSSTSGGWRLIGRTPVRLFDHCRQAPARLSPGDHVRFRPVEAGRFDELARRPA
jgi:inhibitor of KinA